MSEIAEYIARKRHKLFLSACAARDIYWETKNDMVKDATTDNRMTWNFLGVRVRAMSGWIQIAWIKREFYTSKKKGKHGFWKHVSGMTKKNQRVPTGSIGRSSAEVKNLFNEYEDRFSKIRKEQEGLKAFYKSAVKYAKEHDSEMLSSLEAIKDWQPEDPGKRELEW